MSDTERFTPPDEERGLFRASFRPWDGWVVLLPWLANPSGYWWRPYLPVQHPDDSWAEKYAKHLVAELNREQRREASAFVRSLDPMEAECDWEDAEKIAYAVRDHIAAQLEEKCRDES